ncbi:MAG: sugar phosphate isomerase/epimerase [Clostridia bacterium]|nr:sugar phosphate isomerase/epimerase [Clostridia bacterium]
MTLSICGAPCSWGVDDVNNPFLPPWRTVLDEAARAGYRAIELGPYGYLPLDWELLAGQLQENGISIVAGTIFNDLVSRDNHANVMRQADEICALITSLPPPPTLEGQRYPAPYLTIMDWGHDERDYAAGHSDKAPRLDASRWGDMAGHIRDICLKAREYGVRPVIHPHAGGYIEFPDEIEAVLRDIPKEIAGLCLDTGHLAYSGMDPAQWIRKCAPRMDYLHFKDINPLVYKDVMSKRIRFFEGCAEGSMCPIGTGCLDYVNISEALKEIGYCGYVTIEQERDPRNSQGRLEDIKRSIDYLKGKGYQI